MSPVLLGGTKFVYLLFSSVPNLCKSKLTFCSSVQPSQFFSNIVSNLLKYARNVTPSSRLNLNPVIQFAIPLAVNDEFTGLFFNKIASYNAFVSSCCWARNSNSFSWNNSCCFCCCSYCFCCSIWLCTKVFVNAINSSILPKMFHTY